MSTFSKYALIFHNRLLSFDQDIELVDIICKAQDAKDFLKDETLLFSYLDVEKHTALNTRGATNKSREIVVKHLKATVFSAYIKDIYEELTSYLKSLLYEAALLAKDTSCARRILGEHKITIMASDILTYSNINDLILKVAEDILQALENERSTKELIKKIGHKTGISIEEQKLEVALPYLELRHKLVHTDGKIDSDFKSKYTMFICDKDDYVVLTYETILAAKTAIEDLILAIDNAAIEKGILSPN